MDKQPEQLIRDYISAYNRFDVAGMLLGLHEQVRFQNIAAGEVNLATHGKAEFRAQAEQATRLFKQREQRLLALRCTDNQAEASIAYWAILAVDLPNGLKANDELTGQGKSIFEFEDGKIIAIQDIS